MKATVVVCPVTDYLELRELAAPTKSSTQGTIASGQICSLQTRNRQTMTGSPRTKRAQTRPVISIPEGSGFSFWELHDRIRLLEAKLKEMENKSDAKLEANVEMLKGYLRRELFKNIVLSGGNTMFPNIEVRMTNEIKALAPQKIDVKVVANPQRRYIVWMGASIVTQLSSFQKSSETLPCP